MLPFLSSTFIESFFWSVKMCFALRTAQICQILAKDIVVKCKNDKLGTEPVDDNHRLTCIGMNSSCVLCNNVVVP